MARRRLKQVVSGRLVRFGIGPQQFWALLHLFEEEGLSLHELAQRTWTDDPTACRMIAKLTDRGLVKSNEDPDDRRRFRLGLTAKGRKLAGDLASFAEEIRETATSGMSSGERKKMCGLLRQVMTNLDEIEAAGDRSKAKKRKKAA